MCGIVGFWQAQQADLNCLMRMNHSLSSRGPDDEGVFVSNSGDLAFGHRRLAILDTSSKGRQPMSSRCGRYTITFNGEIYNHLNLREFLYRKGYIISWESTCDTETILGLCSVFGIETCLQLLNGMFAFALWDNESKKLFLVRDRMGEKPLYYGKLKDGLIFASQLKAFECHDDWQSDLDQKSISLFLENNHVPAPRSIFKNAKKLLPGHFVVISKHGSEVSEPKKYWDLMNLAQASCNELPIDPTFLQETFSEALTEAVSSRMSADAPIGAFLSGGIDSSLVVAKMQELSMTPIKTFTIGNQNNFYNEANDAKKIADILGTEHIELYVNEEDVLSVIPNLPDIYDEPFADSSQIPTLLVSKLASKCIKVALTGDGADELFGGYNRHSKGVKLWKAISCMPQPARNLLSKTLMQVSELKHNTTLFDTFLERDSGYKLEKLGFALGASNLQDYYQGIKSHLRDDITLWKFSDKSKTSQLLSNPLRELLLLDQLTYLPDDILTKVDRATMSVGLEARAPFLDHKLVELSWKLPDSYKVKNGKGKIILRQELSKYIPEKVYNRPKKGFSLPVSEWLSGPLINWAEDLLCKENLLKTGIFDLSQTQELWETYKTKNSYQEFNIWNVLMLQSWMLKYKS